MGKRESPQSERETGVSDPGVFKLDRLQTVKLILFQKCFTFFTFYTGRSNSLLPQREEERKQHGQIIGKRDSFKSG